MQSQWVSRLAYILSLGGLCLWGGLVAATALFGVTIAFPANLIWVAAAGLPALGIALLFLVATGAREEEGER